MTPTISPDKNARIAPDRYGEPTNAPTTTEVVAAGTFALLLYDVAGADPLSLLLLGATGALALLYVYYRIVDRQEVSRPC